jgi:hypothetical protein
MSLSVKHIYGVKERGERRGVKRRSEVNCEAESCGQYQYQY